MKDYLQASGIVITPVTPREVIKQAFFAKLFEDGQVWIDMMLHRHQLSHTDDFSKFVQILEAVKERYLPTLEYLHTWLMARTSE